MQVGLYSVNEAAPVVRCKFIALCTALGDPLQKWEDTPYGIRAKVIRLSSHPRLGSAHPAEGFTITSEVKVIDFELGVIITQNTIYRWK